MSASGGGPLQFFFGMANLPDASYSWSMTTHNPPAFDGHRISFAGDSSPTFNQSQTVYWYDWVILVAAGIADIDDVIKAIGDALSGFNGGEVLEAMMNIGETLERATCGSVTNLSSLIDWSVDGESLTASNAGLSGALYVHGNLG